MKRSIAPVLLTALLLTPVVLQQASAQSEALNIEAPPEGELSRKQLAKIAKDIRRLEVNPFAPDFEKAFATLLVWTINTPDLTITVCPGLIDMATTKSEDPVEARLFMMSLLSSAAWIIENPEQADDLVQVNLGGVEGMLRLYRTVQEAMEDEYTIESAEKLRILQDEGKLPEHVAEVIGGCGEEDDAEEAGEEESSE